jgi:hypothetical protein
LFTYGYHDGKEFKRGLVLWKEGREWEERLMSVTVKQRKTGIGECYLDTRGGSPHPRANEQPKQPMK